MACHHFEDLKKVPGAAASYAKGCEECVKIGGTWVHLRECLNCGRIAMRPRTSMRPSTR